jgi:hypothetical protein
MLPHAEDSPIGGRKRRTQPIADPSLPPPAPEVIDLAGDNPQEVYASRAIIKPCLTTTRGQWLAFKQSASLSTTRRGARSLPVAVACRAHRPKTRRHPVCIDQGRGNGQGTSRLHPKSALARSTRFRCATPRSENKISCQSHPHPQLRIETL